MGSKKISGIEQLVDDATAELRRRSDRISALEATERELREALKVLAADLLNGWHYADTGKDWPDSTTSEVHNNPIAAAAVREAGR